MKKYILIILLSSLLFSCYSSEKDKSYIWDLSFSDVEISIKLKNYQFLNNINFSRLERQDRLKEIYKLHPGGAFYLSHIFEEMGDFENQIRFLKTEMLYGYWKKDSAIKIFQLLSQKEEWRDLSRHLFLYLDNTEGDADIENLLMESLYKDEQYGRVLSISQNDFSSFYSFASLVQLNDKRWKSLISEFIYNGASSQEINDVFDLLKSKDLLNEIDVTDRLFILAISSYYNGDYRESREFFENLQLTRNIYNTYPSIFYTLRIPLEKTNLSGKWSDLFSSMSRTLNEKSSFSASFVSARLYLSEKDFINAERLFRQSIRNATTDFEADRAMWYLMNLYKNNVYYFAGLLEEFAPQWKDPNYFDDILDDYLALISSRGEWILFDKIYSSIVLYCDVETIASYSWVKYLALQSNLLTESNPDDLFERMKDSYHLSFYNLMGTILEGKDLVFDDYKDPHPEYSEKDELISGFLHFNLTNQALLYTKGIEKLLNDDVLRQTSQLASQSGDHLRSIQLISYVSSDSGIRYSLEDLKLLYPNEYENLIIKYADIYGFFHELLSGIIRTESAFTADIVSYAGAVGLSQLMPETAMDQARKLDIINPDLTDPETNIRIGSSYIQWIMERPWSDNISQMLIAYNAGGGNLRKWKRLYPDYRDELFAELIPYKETRNYVRKVLTSSIIYGTIYNGETPEEIVRRIYPDFISLKSFNKQ